MGKIIKMPDKRLTLNTVYCADNLAIMKMLPNESIDLIYIDPPFNTRSVQRSKAWDEQVQGLEYYDSYGNGMMSYIEFMKERLRHMHRLLKPTGSLFVHADYRSIHYLKTELDKIFGNGNIDKGSKHLVNEIIWCFSQGGRSKKNFGKKHNTVLWYSKDKNNYVFNGDLIRIEMKSGKESFGGKLCTDENGRKYRLVYGTKNKKGETKYYKYYLDEGKIPEDYWIDINSLQSGVTERLGYPTQKPLALLERIIQCASNKNDIVADFFCGCGTALSAAQKLDRHWIGVDASKEAVKVIRKRMMKEHNLTIHESTLEKATLSEAFKMSPKDFEIEMVQSLGGVPNKKGGGDGGIDGTMADTGEPIQVKQFIPSRADFDKFYKHLKKHGQGSYIAYDFTSGIKEEVMRLKNEEGIECRLYTVGDLLGIPRKEYKEKLKEHLAKSKKKAA